MKIYVGNLAYNVTTEDLRPLFEKYGEVVSIKIVKDRVTHKSRGFGFVEITEEKKALKSIRALNNRELKGRKIKVNKVLPRYINRNTIAGGRHRN